MARIKIIDNRPRCEGCGRVCEVDICAECEAFVEDAHKALDALDEVIAISEGEASRSAGDQ